jgi:hypothetical protein
MEKKLFSLIVLVVAAVPSAFAFDSCSSDCSAKKEGKEAICRAKTDPYAVKDCLSSMEQDFQNCKQACYRSKGEKSPESSTAPTKNPPTSNPEK